jgi:hypothetical protein
MPRSRHCSYDLTPQCTPCTALEMMTLVGYRGHWLGKRCTLWSHWLCYIYRQDRGCTATQMFDQWV